MDALAISPSFLLHKLKLGNVEANLTRSKISVGVRGLCISSLNASASSFENSSQEDDSEEPPILKKDFESGVTASECPSNGEESVKNGIPSKESLHKLERGAESKRNSNTSAKPPSQQQESAELRVHEAGTPSWAVTVLTFAAAFSAGVALSQLPGSKPDVRVAPSGMASVPYPEQLLNHFRAEEAPESDLKAVLADKSVRLRSAAADAFLRMQDAARNEGIWLIPLSGFRSVRSQQEVFFDIKAERMQSVTERAKVSAPPGYSEHHTGYAIDIGDPTDPEAYLNPEFDEGAAYRWLQQNAARFHFELSFPKDNLQGIMYEPWHWRFVGDDHSLHTFYAQHKLYNSFPRCNT